MTFAIAGVSGNTGKVVADTLLSQGKKVRVIVRDAAKGAPWKARGAEVVVADLTNTGTLAAALAGVEGAYLLVPPTADVPSFRAYQESVVRSLTRAVATAKVPHVVFLSSAGAQHDAGTGPIAGLHFAEHAFAAIPETVTTFLRAGYFVENLGGGSLQQLGQGILPTFTPATLPFPVVATVDIGRLAAELLVEGARKTGIVELGSLHTYEKFGKALSNITGRPIQVVEAPLDAMVGVLKSVGFTEDLAGLFREMTHAINSGRVAFEGGHRSVAGRTPPETVLRELLGQR